MISELELLKQRITELEAENAELRKENTEIFYLRNKLSVSDAEIAELKRRNNEFLRANKEYNERRDAKNAKLKAENVEFRDRLTKVEQKQTQNELRGASHNSSNNNSSNFNLVAEPMVMQHKKPLVDEEMDTSLPEELIPEELTEVTVSAINIFVIDQCDQKSLEDKETDAFLDEKYKKSVSNDIRQKNRKKKLLRESAKNQVYSKLSLSTGDNISVPSSIEDNLLWDTKMITCTDNEDAPSDEMSELIATQPFDRNQVTEQTLKHELSRLISSVGSVKLHDESILKNAIESFTQRLAYWIDEAMKIGLKEILYLYHYSFEFEEKVKNITADGKTKDKTARSMIYKEMLQYLPNVTPVTPQTIRTSLTYDRAYFRDKALDQYSNLYREFSSENFDYYGITDETSYPLYKLDHDDEEGIEGDMKQDLILLNVNSIRFVPIYTEDIKKKLEMSHVQWEKSHKPLADTSNLQEEIIEKPVSSKSDSLVSSVLVAKK
ncbi:hypothetical protein C1645_830685 [Glomus cerebriforme]|uniref:Uncharacterized protein n=1 Tax=Glomus cerebriforme TaxID=658196 RepID=A0A397SLN5_9GLOM|nr:hypothetical protein C1645_830685 [Glomus cerebriforme]